MKVWIKATALHQRRPFTIICTFHANSTLNTVQTKTCFSSSAKDQVKTCSPHLFTKRVEVLVLSDTLRAKKKQSLRNYGNYLSHFDLHLVTPAALLCMQVQHTPSVHIGDCTSIKMDDKQSII